MNPTPHLRSEFCKAVILIGGLLTTVCRPALADEPFVQWANSYSNLNTARICPTPDRGLLLPRWMAGNNGFDALVKLDGNGNVISSFAPPIQDLVDLKAQDDGSICCSGYGGTNRNTFSVSKLNPGGTLAWKTEATPPPSGLTSVASFLASDTNGNVYALGVSQGPITIGSFTFGAGNGLLLCKFDGAGQVLWAERILNAAGVTGTYSRAAPASLSVDPNGNIVFSGWLDPGTLDFLGTSVNIASRTDVWGDAYVAKCDPNGNLIWIHAGNLDPTGIQTGLANMSNTADRQGNIYFLLGGEWLGKLDPDGNLIWAKEFPGAQLSFGARGVTIDADGGAVFGGTISGTVSFDSLTLRPQTADAQGFFVAKSDGDGNIRWVIAGGSAAADRWSWVACNGAGDMFMGSTILAAGSFDGITLPSRPDIYGQIFVAAKLAERPQLKISKSVGFATITYPAKATNYVLEATALLPAVAWDPVTNTASVSGRNRSVQLPATGDVKFFRLRTP